MCTYEYLHHHHLPPCPRPIDMVVHYSYCPKATTDSRTGAPQPCAELDHQQHQQQQHQQQQQAVVVVDYNDPCATGGCLVSPECSSGGCRLAQLGGRWRCCSCGGRANRYRECRRRLPACPDTFCYHVCCAGCSADPPSSSSSSPSSDSSKRRR